MSNISYDLDTSGGLMPLIRALIKPPEEDANAQKPKKPQHPYYKRPGKGHNHDSCDACGEGGDLICCDRCPASFHLGCYDPPLDEQDIPAGLWLCRECRASDAEKPPSSRGSRPQSPVDSSDRKTRSLRNSRANSTKKKSKDEEEDEKEKEKELTPMETLVKAARVMNPRQFELPREMRVPCLFPGTEKEGGKNGNSSLISVDSWGCVPLPAKLCFVCEGTCKQAPLLQCDYCPLLYHQDCLDPPLTALPTGRWMCPNHVEQYIDWKLVNSISATERVALWEKFSGPVDQHAIKIDFIRRARNRNPAFRIKVPVGVSGRVSVPGMVRLHYRRPPPLLPSRREYLRCDNVLKRLKGTAAYDEITAPGPKYQICLNVDCPQYKEGREWAPCPHSAHAHRRSPAVAKEEVQTDESQEEKHTESSSDLSDSDFEYLTASVKRRKISSKSTARVELRADDDIAELLACVDSQLMQLDTRLVRLLAWQRLQQVMWGEQCFGEWSMCGVGPRVSACVRRSVAGAKLARRGARLPSALLSAADRRRIAAAVWGPPPSPNDTEAAPLETVPAGLVRATLSAVYEHRRRGARLPSALLNAADRRRIAAAVWGPPPSPNDTDAAPQETVPAGLVRATLSAVYEHRRNGVGESVGQPIPMRSSSLTIGTDSGCRVRLSRSCRRASPHHATIFMDEVTRHFELINYSEWGTEVNGVLYACDLTPRPLTPDGDRARPLRQLLRTERPARRVNGELTMPTGDEGPCRCGGRGPGDTSGAWEGSAIVPHAALLRFGCLAYVFSIADCLDSGPHAV